MFMMAAVGFSSTAIVSSFQLDVIFVFDIVHLLPVDFILQLYDVVDVEAVVVLAETHVRLHSVQLA